MRRPRLRSTVRRMMLAVAITGAVLGLLAERRSRFLRLAEHYRARAGTWVLDRPILESTPRYSPFSFIDPDGRDVPIPRSRWHRQLAATYRAAAARPWLPVEPDPPEPE